MLWRGLGNTLFLSKPETVISAVDADGIDDALLYVDEAIQLADSLLAMRLTNWVDTL